MLGKLLLNPVVHTLKAITSKCTIAAGSGHQRIQPSQGGWVSMSRTSRLPLKCPSQQYPSLGAEGRRDIHPHRRATCSAVRSARSNADA